MDIESAVQLSNDELYEALGRDLTGGVGMGQGDPRELKIRAQRWFEKNRAALRERICGSNVASLAREKPDGWDPVLLVAAIADLISSLKLGVSPVTVAALVVKVGLAQLCADKNE